MASTFLPILLAALLGLAAGSFISAYAHRWPEGEGLLAGRSRCPLCGRRLGVLDLLPVIGWALRGGRCRHCGARIAWRYPLLELAGAAMAGASLWLLGPEVGWIGALLGWAALAVIAVDLRHMAVPDAISLPLVPAGLLAAYGLAPGVLALERLGVHLVGALVGAGVFAAILIGYRHLRGREGMGWGDVKMMAAAGAWLGPLALPYLVALAGAAALAKALAGRCAGRPLSASQALPFGAYLAGALWVLWLLKAAPSVVIG